MNLCENLTHLSSPDSAAKPKRPPRRRRLEEMDSSVAARKKHKFWSTIVIAESGCWNWGGSRAKDGYGIFRCGPESRAHRVAYLFGKGVIPKGLWVLHHCDNPACCNPLHLYVGTAKQNSRDRDVRGRANVPSGEKCWKAKLNRAKVLEIRRLYGIGMTQTEIGKMFSIDHRMVWNVVHRHLWKHVT